MVLTEAGRRLFEANYTVEGETRNCAACHNGNVAPKNVQGEFGKLSIHPVAATTGVHDPAEAATIAARHVECVDCHNPHAASKEPRNLITWRPNPFDPTGGSFGGQVGGANKGVWGVEPTYDSSGWKAPTKFAVVENSENMYQLCFKCHSAYAYGAGSSYSIPATAPSPPQIPMGKLSSTSSGGCPARRTAAPRRRSRG